MVWPSRCAARITKGRGESARPLGPAPAFGSKMLAYSPVPAVSRSMIPKAPRSVFPALPGGKYSDPAARKWKRSRMRSRVTASLCESGGVHLYGTRKDTLHESCVRLMPVTPVRSVLKISTADRTSPELGHYKQYCSLWWGRPSSFVVCLLCGALADYINRSSAPPVPGFLTLGIARRRLIRFVAEQDGRTRQLKILL